MKSDEFLFELQLFGDGNDIDLGLDDEEEDELDPEGPDPYAKFDPEIPDEEDPSKKKPKDETEGLSDEDREEYERLKREKARREREELENLRSAPPPQQRPAAQVPPQQHYEPEPSVKDIFKDKKFSEAFMANPDEAMERFADGLEKVVEAKVQRRIASAVDPVQSETARGQIRDFLANKKDEDAEEYLMAKKYFDEEVAKVPAAAYSRMSPEALAAGIANTWDKAVGVAYREQRKNKSSRQRSSDPPNYAGATNAGGGARRTKSSLSIEEKQIVKTARQAGLSDKDIREMIAEHRAEEKVAEKRTRRGA